MLVSDVEFLSEEGCVLYYKYLRIIGFVRLPYAALCVESNRCWQRFTGKSGVGFNISEIVFSAC